MRVTCGGDLIGSSAAIRLLREEIERVARSNATVLLTGESGVGKELVARAIHRDSVRAGGSFQRVNCGGLSETLLEARLFGHVKGFHPGTDADKTGQLELAHSGTLFLDGISDMTLHTQCLFLRFLETGELQKVGATDIVGPLDVRIIAATSASLQDMIAHRTFREDMFYRLNVIHIAVPPLRERREDIPDLLGFFLSRFITVDGSGVQSISPEAVRLMARYAWPGNVRELANVVERLVVTGRQKTIGPEDLPLEIRASAVPSSPARVERTIADDLFAKLTEERKSFWTTVYPLYIQREITRTHVRDVVRMGLEEARGNYRIVARLFNMEPRDYKRFLNFLRKHDCQVPFKEYRTMR